MAMLAVVAAAAAAVAAAADAAGCHAWPYFNQTVCWPPAAVTRWRCAELGSLELAPGVAWTRRRCSMDAASESPPPWYTQRPYQPVPPGVPANMPWNASAWLVGPITLNTIGMRAPSPPPRRRTA